MEKVTMIDVVKEYVKSSMSRFCSNYDIEYDDWCKMIDDAQGKWDKLRIICEKIDKLIDLCRDVEARLEEEEEDRRLPLYEMNKIWDAQELAIRITIAMTESIDKPGGIFEYWQKEYERAESTRAKKTEKEKTLDEYLTEIAKKRKTRKDKKAIKRSLNVRQEINVPEKNFRFTVVVLEEPYLIPVAACDSIFHAQDCAKHYVDDALPNNRVLVFDRRKGNELGKEIGFAALAGDGEVYWRDAPKR